MAKKKQELTPEERLAAALVPKEEQPYPLPEGWKWVRIGKIFIDATDSKKKIKQKDYCSDGKWPIIDQGQTFIGGFSDIDAFVYKDELPVIIFGDHTRNVKYIDFRFIQGADGVKVVKPQPFVYSKFLFWLLKGIPFPSLGYRRHFPILKKMVAPLPFFDEQQRLVARIESLFAKLDAAKEKVQSVFDAHEMRKAALLQDAFAGKMTTEWRASRNISYDDWRLVSIQDICHSLKYGTAKKSESSGRYVVIRMGNLFDGEILWENLAYSNDEDDIKKYQLSPGDILFNRTNSAALVGKTSIYRGEYPAIYAGYIIKLDYDREVVVGEFLNYVMNSAQAKSYCNRVKTDGVNQSNINAKKIGAFQFRLPTFSEQQEIVRILNKMFAREKRVKQSAESVLETIDRMKQSILARAFRGEL